MTGSAKHHSLSRDRGIGLKCVVGSDEAGNVHQDRWVSRLSGGGIDLHVVTSAKSEDASVVDSALSFTYPYATYHDFGGVIKGAEEMPSRTKLESLVCHRIDDIIHADAEAQIGKAFGVFGTIGPLP